MKKLEVKEDNTSEGVITTYNKVIKDVITDVIISVIGDVIVML